MGKTKSFRKSLGFIHFHVKIISRHVSVKGCITLSKSWWSTFSKIVVRSPISNSDIGHFLSFHPAFVKTQKYILSFAFWCITETTCGISFQIGRDLEKDTISENPQYIYFFDEFQQKRYSVVKCEAPKLACFHYSRKKSSNIWWK